ncbi:hypothetical protein QYF36_007277 [Acer negundo]|nr:hypothetical protein QYF36_007277 [Acer negundo]
METPKPKYPPPITTLPFVMKRKCTSDGRLILTMEKPHDDDDEDMKAHRSNDDDVKDVNVSESGSKLVIMALLKITIRRKLALYMQNHHRKNPVKRTIVKKWIPPSDDELKFNVDGSCNLELGRTGIGGVLRDSDGIVLCSFSAFVGKVDAHTAELMAVYKACILSAANEALRGRKISFESDSMEAIAWVKDADFGNLLLVDVIYDIRAKMRLLDNSTLNFIPIAANSMADGLAKRGMAMEGEDVEWNVF